jgi:hypothetical protein
MGVGLGSSPKGGGEARQSLQPAYGHNANGAENAMTDDDFTENSAERKRDPATQQLVDCMRQWSGEWRHRPGGSNEEAVSRILSGAMAYIEELESALAPFATVADRDIGSDETDKDIYRPANFNHAPKLTVGDLRAASSVLNGRREDTFERLDSVAARVVSKSGGGE